MHVGMKALKNKLRRVLAIDPGYDRLGIAVLEGDASKPIHVWSDCVIPPKGKKESRLAVVYKATADAIQEYNPDILALETLFFSSNKTTAIGVAEARGAVLAAAGAAEIPLQEYAPQQVKLAVTGYGASDKAAIARMIPHLITLPPKKRLDDELDAIALGIAGLADRRT
ncbi:MAG: crossover junction endodeoxyribonuclease RuvC [Parcubacteria bacterium C7867-008]|nr:MAG: crossover junction endodeoxyribonuclease RuvC [Parcubacteria bacterium C7867-008]